jgi:hypothetical protein
MYLPLMHEIMKLMEMLSRVVLFALSKYGQIITPFIHSRDNIRKTRNNRKIKRSKPLSQDFVHFEPAESSIDPSNMESPGERCAVRVCLVFVHHQRPDLIVVFSQGVVDVARGSRTETVESPGASMQSSMVLMSDAPSESEALFRSTQGNVFNSFPGNDARNVSTQSRPSDCRKGKPDTHQSLGGCWFE